MNRVLTYFLLSIVVSLSLSFSNAHKLNENEATAVFSRLKESVASIKSLEFTLVNYERIDDVLLKGKQKVLLTTSPFQCYILMIEPGEGEELVYAGERYDFKAIYQPNGFPYIQLELDPYGGLMRKNNHHTIFDLGFSSMMDILNYHMKRSDYKLDMRPIALIDQEAFVLSIEFTNFSYHSYQVILKESISELAKRLMLSDYMIAKMNEMEISDILKLGDVISIPNSYAKKIELSIDIKNGLPFQEVIYDDKGIFERYEFFDLIVNSPISNDQFNAEFLGK